jgi:hypothetical protein
MMTTLTVDGMRVLHGAVIPRTRRGGAYCGFLLGAMWLTIGTGHLIAAAGIYIFTPVTCLFDFAL